MRVCSKCGLPDNGTGVCNNCASTSFIELRSRSNNSYNTVTSKSYANSANGFAPQQPPQYYYQNNAPRNIPYVPGATSAAQAVDTAVKTASKLSVAKILMIVFACIAVIAAGITIPVVVVQNENTPEKTIEKFEEAYNNADFNAMIECFDSKTRNAYDSGDDLLGGVLGFSYKSALGMIPFLADAMGEEMPKIHFEVESVDETDKKSCIVNVAVYYNNDKSEYDEDTIKMVKESGKWYISDEELLNSF